MDPVAHRSWSLPRLQGHGLPRPRGDGPISDREERQAVRRLPRPRGDGPSIGRSPTRQLPTGLPRPRGDGPVGCAIAEAMLGSPAHAGMDRRCARCLAGALAWAPPPTRGWTPGPRANGSPAHAGMDRGRRAATRTTRQAPPPTRGWTRPGSRARPRLPRRGRFLPIEEMAPGSPAHAGMDLGMAPVIRNGSPAHAGMDRHQNARTMGLGLPRPRGDGPPIRPARGTGLRAPPPTQGFTNQD